MFTANGGQFAPSVLYKSRSGRANVYIKKNGVDFAVGRVKDVPLPTDQLVRKHYLPEYDYTLWSLSFLNVNADVSHGASEPMEGKERYYVGNKNAEAVTSKSVTLHNLYDNVDVRYYGEGQNLKYDVILKPNFNAAGISLQYTGVKSIAINDKQQLVVTTAIGDFVEDKPYAYQLVSGVKKEVDVSFVIKNKAKAIFGFSIRGSYDPSVDLIIDPLLFWSTFNGGLSDDFIYGMATDDNGNVIVTGWTTSQSFPTTTGAYDGTFNGGAYDVFVTKYSPDGVKLWSTFLGGSGTDTGYGITTDSNNNIILTGQTESVNFPTTPGAFQPAVAGGLDVFLTKLDENGGMLWSTFFGGSLPETGECVTIAANDEIILSGHTRSFDFPVTNDAYQQVIGGNVTNLDVFVASFDATGNRRWCTYLGGSGDDMGEAVAIDKLGNIVVAGETLSTDFPIKNAFQNTNAGSYDILAAKLSPDGKNILWSTYYGGNTYDICAESVGIDSQNNVVIAGHSSFQGFPVTLPVTFIQYPTELTGNDMFILKLGSDGNRIWSTIYGGRHGGNSGCWALTISSCDKIWLAFTSLHDPWVVEPLTPNAFPTVTQADFKSHVMVVALTPDGLLDFASYFGGSQNDEAWGIVSDRAGNIVVAGNTVSADFTVHNAAQQYYFDLHDGFVFKFKPDDSSFIDFTLNNTGCSLLANAEYTPMPGDVVTWHWGDGQTTTGDAASTHAYTTPGTYTVSLDVQNSACRGGVNTKTIEVSPPPSAQFTWNSTCSKEVAFTFTGTATTVKWQFDSDDPQTTNTTNPIHTFPGVGPFLVTLTAISGQCSDSASQTVNVTVSPEVNLPSQIDLCEGQSYLLNAASPDNGTTYRWNDGATSPVFLVTVAGTYSVTLTNSCGTTNAVVNAILAQKPVVDLGTDFTLCNGSSKELVATYPGAGYQWNDGSTSSTYLVVTAGSYAVTVSNACGSAIDSVVAYNCVVEIPNVITPNGDGKNDTFVVSGLHMQEIHLRIVNRWGEPIYIADDYKNDWSADGLTSGVYYYTVAQADAVYQGWVEVVK
ncbi:SBBP repeat-containing protein [Chryseolinea soli]|uniref:DUF7948 domain-containing protein n=1 Tax=Chryseolinea soli TaxID=2321403 RepID=UPI001359B28C|nr:SBBP repeat-containing protein [Chryseolinea soli]